MATLTYDFEADTIGSVPSGFSFLFGSAGGTGNVIAGKYWTIDPPTPGGKYYINDDTGSLTDCIVTGSFYRNTPYSETRIYVRHTGDAEHDGYLVTVTASGIQMDEFVNGSYIGSMGTASKTFNAVTWYNFRVEATGTTIRAWAGSGSWPGTWDISATDSTHSSGYVLFGNSSTSTSSTQFDDISITSDDISIDVDVTQDPVGALTITGYNPTVYQGITVVPRSVDSGTIAGVLHISGFNPTIAALPINVYPTLGTLSISGLSPTVTGQFNTAVTQDPLGTLSITGYNPTVTLPNIASPVGSLVVTGFSPTVSAEASAVHLYIKFKDAAGNVWTREIDRKPPVVEVSANRIASSTDEVVVMDATGGDLTYTLPSLTGRNGFVYEVKKSDSSANTVTVVGTIDNDANFILEAQDECVTVKGGTSTWWITT